MPRQPKNRRLAREAIITYYRRHARGSKVTLKELAAQYGVDYGYTRTIKVAYDANRRRGKKPAATLSKADTKQPSGASDGSESD